MAITISGSGITSANIADGTIVNADVSDVAASKLTGALPAIDGSALTGVGGGKVLQVVNFSVVPSQTSSSNVWADTVVTLNITPTLTTSKILAIVNVTGCRSQGATYLGLQLLRGSTSIIHFEGQAGYTNSTLDNTVGTCSTSYLDSPATTSAVTYKVQMRAPSNVGVVRIGDSSSYSTITLMEIGV